MDCIITGDYNLDEFCDVSSSGVLELKVTAHKRSEETFSQSLVVGEEKIINGVLTGSTAATGANWKVIHQDIEIAEATQDTEGSRETGTVAYPQKVMLTMHFGSDPIRNGQIIALAEELETKNCVLALKMQDGTQRLYGRVNGLRGTEGSDSTGKAMADLNGIAMVLNGKEPKRWYPIRENEGTPANIAVGYQAIALS